ncbi:MAG: hypothetical protein FJ005_00675 [Chloroflexi bacterium]|nr:hypothetical protein [Chloroflexota bacterium]
MKRSRRTNLIEKILVKTSKAQRKVQKQFMDSILRCSTPRLEHIAKNVKVKNRGKSIVVE